MLEAGFCYYCCCYCFVFALSAVATSNVISWWCSAGCLLLLLFCSGFVVGFYLWALSFLYLFSVLLRFPLKRNKTISLLLVAWVHYCWKLWLYFDFMLFYMSSRELVLITVYIRRSYTELYWNIWSLCFYSRAEWNGGRFNFWWDVQRKNHITTLNTDLNRLWDPNPWHSTLQRDLIFLT